MPSIEEVPLLFLTKHCLFY